jgi:hypothetical protein
MQDKVIRIEQQPHTAPRASNDWKVFVDKLSYKGIVNNIPYLAFIVLLCVLYITSNQRTIETQRKLNDRIEELKELRWKYMDVKSRLMNAGMEAEVIVNASVIGLKPMMLPAYSVTKDTEKK